MRSVRRRCKVSGPVLVTVAIVIVACTHPAARSGVTLGRPSGAVTVRPVADTTTEHIRVIGWSRDHRAIRAVQVGDADSPDRVLVVGCIHGNERAGIAITRALARAGVPREVDLWLIPVLNPDGAARNTRGNGRGVDLNRNFPYRWRPLTGLYSSGPHALSEPESRAAARLIDRLKPTLAIWYHQHLNVVDGSEGPVRLVRRYAADTHMRVASLSDEPGSATGYENHRFGATAFVVELPAGQLDQQRLRRHVRAVLDVATSRRA